MRENDIPSGSIKDLLLEEAERAPNRYAAKAFHFVVIALFVAILLNLVGVFEIDSTVLLNCFGVALICYIISYALAHHPKLSVAPLSKYVMILMSLVITVTIEVMLNINALVFILFPMLLSTRYRSIKITVFAAVGSAVCCFVYPILGRLWNTWNPDIILGYLETLAKVSVVTSVTSTMPEEQAITSILLYHSLPQFMLVAAFSGIFIEITLHNIRGLNSRVQTMRLSEKLNRELMHESALHDQILWGISDMVESRDETTGGHVKRTSEVVSILIREMQKDPKLQLTEDYCSAVIHAAPLHDLGKIAVDDAILRKPGKLDEDEAKLMQQHPIESAKLIKRVFEKLESKDFVRIATNIAKYHHERFDGTGYPNGLKGTQIPLEARVMAIVDVYDALISRRSYKEAYSFDQTYEMIEDGMGTLFDPALNPYFQACREAIEAFYEKERKDA